MSVVSPSAALTRYPNSPNGSSRRKNVAAPRAADGLAVATRIGSGRSSSSSCSRS